MQPGLRESNEALLLLYLIVRLTANKRKRGVPVANRSDVVKTEMSRSYFGRCWHVRRFRPHSC